MDRVELPALPQVFEDRGGHNEVEPSHFERIIGQIARIAGQVTVVFEQFTPVDVVYQRGKLAVTAGIVEPASIRFQKAD